MKISDSLKLTQHPKIIDRIPLRFRNPVFKILIKLKIIRRYGKATLIVYRKDGTIEKTEGYNDTVDAGLKRIGDILVGTTTTNLEITQINVGTDNTATTASMTDLQAEAAPAERLTIPDGGKFRSTKLLTFSMLIGSAKYNRPVTIAEMAIFFNPAGSGDMLARAVLSPTKTLESGDAARFDYELSL